MLHKSSILIFTMLALFAASCYSYNGVDNKIAAISDNTGNKTMPKPATITYNEEDTFEIPKGNVQMFYYSKDDEYIVEKPINMLDSTEFEDKLKTKVLLQLDNARTSGENNEVKIVPHGNGYDVQLTCAPNNVGVKYFTAEEYSFTPDKNGYRIFYKPNPGEILGDAEGVLTDQNQIKVSLDILRRAEDTHYYYSHTIGFTTQIKRQNFYIYGF